MHRSLRRSGVALGLPVAFALLGSCADIGRSRRLGAAYAGSLRAAVQRVIDG